MKLELPARLKTYALSFGLGLGLILLIAFLVGEWFAIRQNLTPTMRAEKSSNGDTLGPAIRIEGLNLPNASEFRAVVERPLFMETRRPPPPAPSGPPPKLEPPTPVTFQLMGVITSPKGPLALVGENKGKYRRIRATETIDGWKVKEIHPNQLVLEQGTVKQNINLTKKKPRASDPGQTQNRQHPPTPQNTPPQSNPPSTGARDGAPQEPESQPPSQPTQPPPQETEDSEESY